MFEKINHLAIIMDGNGRWARQRKHNRFFGHVRGAKVAKSIIKACAQNNLKYLTLFAFSSENWSRPQQEVSFLMKLLVRYLTKEKKTLIDNNIVFKTSGEIRRLPSLAQEVIHDLVQSTQKNSGMTLVFALSYGGRQDILMAINKMVSELPKDNQYTEEEFTQYLENPDIPDPDLILRTSGEKRISNFFLWQASYSELEFTNTLWPDFTVKELEKTILDFNQRERRFGSL